MTTSMSRELATKRPAQVATTHTPGGKRLESVRGADGRFLAKRGGASAGKVLMTALLLVGVFLFAGFVLSLVQQTAG